MDLRAKVTTPSRPVSPAKSVITARLNTNSTPNFRPKAKVNSSATTRKAVVTKSAQATASPSVSSTPRSRSPAKLPRMRNPAPKHTPKAPSYSGSASTIRSPALSAPVTPELRTRSLTTPSERGAGSSLHHATSFASLQPKVVRDLTAEIYGLGATPLDREMSGSPTLRIRSKVSSSVLSASPAHRSPNIFTHTSRSPSVSSPVPQPQQPTSPPPQFYPITTATPAANPHRYVSVRPPAPHRTILPAASQVFHVAGLSSSPTTTTNDTSPPSRNRGTIQAKVDPSIVTLPPTSPPMSALSSSSRSSLSRSSARVSVDGVPSEGQSTSTASSRPPMKRNGTVHHAALTATLDNLVQYASSSGNLPSACDSSSDDDDDNYEDNNDDRDEEHKVRAAAKSNRKIADLEITNRSLLAINASLEATKHRQAKEIRELKRKLRESRLILPPRAYQAFKLSEVPLEQKGCGAANADEHNEDDDDGDDDDDEGDEENANDEIYQRIKMLVDNLLKSGQRALEEQIQDFADGGKGGGAKVLTAEEVRDWHQSTHASDDDLHHNPGNEHDDDDYDDDDNLIIPAAASFEERTITGNDSLTISEAEVEAMTIPSTDIFYSPSSPPPIFITKPS